MIDPMLDMSMDALYPEGGGRCDVTKTTSDISIFSKPSRSPGGLTTKGSGRPSRYATSSGEVVPGVTTVLQLLGKGDALLGWAAKLARQGKDWRKERDAAADLGTEIHERVEAMIHAWMDGADRGPLYEGRSAIVQHAMRKFEEWELANRVDWLGTEVPYVSDVYRFGGCLDAVGIIGGKLTLIDFKTSKSVYETFLLQCAAYDVLYREKHRQGFERFVIVSLPKDGTGDVKTVDLLDLGPSREIFLKLRAIHELLPNVKGLL